MSKVTIKIPQIHEDEEYNLLPESICDKYHMSHSRYLISNYSRIFDTSTEKFILAYPANEAFFLLRTLSNTIVLVNAEELIKEASSDDNDYLARRGLMITNPLSIAGYIILDRDLVMYIRNAHYSPDRDISLFSKELCISRFSYSFAVTENFIKFENSCEIRENDLSLSLQFMEAVDVITNKNPKLRIKTVTEMICNKMGIEFDMNIYSKVSNFYSGRASYIYIPKNVQRLVE